MKKFNRRSLIALLAIMVLVVSSIGVTVAYFSAETRAQGSAKLSLQGQTTIDEGDKDTEKNVTIQNVGESDVIVRVAFFGPGGLTEGLKIAASGDWVDGGDGFYYYKQVLKAGEDGNGDKTAANTLVGTVTLSEKEAAEFGTDFTVTVVQECSTIVYENGVAKAVAGWKLPFTITE